LDTISLLAGLGFIAGFNEWTIERFLGQWDSPSLNKCLVYIAGAVGLAEAFLFKLNALPAVGIDIDTTFGYLVTGIVIGGGSSVIHQFFGQPSKTNGE